MANSPLFQTFSRALQQQARQQFAKTAFGKVLGEVDQAVRSPGRSQQRIKATIQRYGNATPQRMMRELMGTDFGSFVREIHRYSKSGSDPTTAVVGEFLNALGPAGRLIRALVTGNAGKSGIERELQAAMNLIRAFGGEVLPGQGWGTTEDALRGIEAAKKRLDGLGYKIIPPGKEPQGSVRSDTGKPTRGTTVPDGRKTVKIPQPGGKSRRFPKDHPIVTGEMVECAASTNVHSFGYDLDYGYLYVRFLGGEGRERSGPGSLYRYAGVRPEEFLALYRTRGRGHGTGPGAWVWDNLRIRGTVSGHRKDYELVGIMGGYVPRKATVMPAPGGGVEEWFLRRTVKTQEGKWKKSALPNQVAVAFGGGGRGPGGTRGARGPGRR